MKTRIKSTLTVLGVLLASLIAPALKAQLNFHVDLNTIALNGAPNAPFFLDFQLNEGTGSLVNSVTLTNFTFNNGSATGAPALFGNVTGSLLSSVSLTASPASPFNEFFQGFSAGTTSIHFDATISQHIPGAIPDGFFVAILDSEPGNPQIGTNAPDGVSLLALNLGAANVLRDVTTFSSIAPAGAIATASVFVPVPEASSYALAATTLLGGLILFRRRRMFLGQQS